MYLKILFQIFTFNSALIRSFNYNESEVVFRYCELAPLGAIYGVGFVTPYCMSKNGVTKPPIN